jgi:hypothetical protein
VREEEFFEVVFSDFNSSFTDSKGITKLLTAITNLALTVPELELRSLLPF